MVGGRACVAGAPAGMAFRAVWNGRRTRWNHGRASDNHPSGDPEPSQADRMATLRLSHALAFIEVKLLDHFVVGTSITSMRDKGLLT